MESSYNYFVRDIGSDGQRFDVTPRLSYPVLARGPLHDHAPGRLSRDPLRHQGRRHQGGPGVRRRGHGEGVHRALPLRGGRRLRRARAARVRPRRRVRHPEAPAPDRAARELQLPGRRRLQGPAPVGRDRHHHAGPHRHVLPDQPAQGARRRPGGPPGARVGGRPLHAQPDLHDRAGADRDHGLRNTHAGAHDDDGGRATATARPGDRADPDHRDDERHPQAALGRRRRPDPRAPLRRALPRDRVLRPLRVPRHGRHDRLLLRGGAVARDVRHPPRRERQARLHPGRRSRPRSARRWTVRFASDYNIDTGTVIENRFEVDFREQCWGITAAFIDRVDEDEFRISINLLELGQYGFGRGFAGFQ